jgi:hypothetical protein
MSYEPEIDRTNVKRGKYGTSRLQSDHNHKNVKYTATGNLSSTRSLV